MGKKKMSMKKLHSLFRNSKENPHPWHWRPSCNYPSTHSSRAASAATADIFKTVNSVFFDPNNTDPSDDPWWFTSSSESAASYSPDSDESKVEEEESVLETIIHGARSERLFFEPNGTTSSILGTNNKKKKKLSSEATEPPLFKESVMLAVESEDPYGDFRQSMEEMMECHGLRDRECLERLLEWYLKMNGEKNHGFIVGAFIDLLVGLGSSTSKQPSSSDSTSFGTAVSAFSSVLSASCSFGDRPKNLEEEM